MNLEETLLAVWQQSLVDNLKIVTLSNETYSVRTTAKQKLKQIDFKFEGRDLRGLEQNPNTKSRWAKMAKEGDKVMQFLEGGTYLGVVADGKVHLY
jgi:hypothetical protein